MENCNLQIIGVPPSFSLEQRSLWYDWRESVTKLAADNRDNLFINGNTKNKKICLCFDDAPDEKVTSSVLDILQEFGVKASFALIGKYIDEFPVTVERIYADGHMIINHTWSHPHLTSLNSEEIEKEVLYTEEKIFEITGMRSLFIRPPYGDINRNVVEVISKVNYKTVLWSLDTFDWLGKTDDRIICKVLEGTRPGDIILMHTHKDNQLTVDVLPLIISGLIKKGYEFLDLSEMFGIKPYK